MKDPCLENEELHELCRLLFLAADALMVWFSGFWDWSVSSPTLEIHTGDKAHLNTEACADLMVSLNVRRTPEHPVAHGSQNGCKIKTWWAGTNKEDRGMRHPVESYPGHCDSTRFLTGKKVSCIWFIALLWWTAPCHILMSQALLALNTARPCKASHSSPY